MWYLWLSRNPSLWAIPARSCYVAHAPFGVLGDLGSDLWLQVYK